MDDKAIVNLHLAMTDMVLSSIAGKKSMQGRTGMLSLNCMRTSHFTQEFSLKGGFTLFE